MRKNELIAQLSKMKGNPEIIVYNGFVDDYHHIDSLSLQELYDDNEIIETEVIVSTTERKFTDENDVEGIEWTDKIKTIREKNWSLLFLLRNSLGLPKEKFNKYIDKYYPKRKNAVLIFPKARNKSMADRLGRMEY